MPEMADESCCRENVDSVSCSPCARFKTYHDSTLNLWVVFHQTAQTPKMTW